MSRFQQKYTGTQYAPTVAALIGAMIFTPVVVLASRPVGYATMSVAVFCNVICLGLAWLSWKNAELTIPTLEASVARVH